MSLAAVSKGDKKRELRRKKVLVERNAESRGGALPLDGLIESLCRSAKVVCLSKEGLRKRGFRLRGKRKGG